MQPLVDAVRSTGAKQVIAVQELNDIPEMRGFDASAYIADPNILHEVDPYYGKDLTNTDRDTHFGFLTNKFPILAGELGVNLTEDSPDCRAIPDDSTKAERLVNDTLAYFEACGISWTATAFQPGQLIHDFSTYDVTTLDQTWTCG